MKRLIRFFLLGLWAAGAVTAATGPFAPKPLFRDPVYDGAADPVVIWNPQKQAWWMFYANRLANIPGLSGVAWVHGPCAPRAAGLVGLIQQEAARGAHGPPFDPTKPNQASGSRTQHE